MNHQFEGEPPASGIQTVDATAPVAHRLRIAAPTPVTPAPLEMGDADDVPQPIQLTSRYVTLDGEPWIPVMGEYHFSRDLPERWETELRKMKSGGINVVATYLIWILHEEVEGQIRWDGHRDIRRFIETADRVGLKVVIRIGPWAHGEARNGGFPDWLQALPITHRSNDPAYLDLARRWYSAIEEQVRGLFHSKSNPAGPIVGVQVDNELYDNGPHLGTLRDIAEATGMKASLWTATGWGGAELPRGRVLPVYAGYSDGFWEESDTGWPAFGVMHFTYNTVRDDLTVGADLRDAPAEIDVDATLGVDDPWPFVTCELGGGMAIAYHRRPLVDSDDIAALALTKLGSGSAWQGYYMYHGGHQVLGALSSTQESHATGYPNDMPQRDYDFYAPLGAEGVERPHFHKLRQQHLMLDAFGHALGTVPATIPAPVDGAPRWAVRGDDSRGFLFANNHQPALATLPALTDVQFTVEFDNAAVTIPTEPFTLESGTYFAWPLRQPFGSIRAVSVTAQLVTEITTPNGLVALLGASPGAPVEFQLEGVDPRDIVGASTTMIDGVVIAVPHEAPGLNCRVAVGDTTFVVLDPDSAQSVWRGRIGGRDAVLLWHGSGWFEDDGFVLEAPAHDTELVTIGALSGQDPLESTDGLFAHYPVAADGPAVELPIPEFADKPLVPVRRAGSSQRLSAPTDDDFAALAGVRIAVPEHALDGADHAILSLDWTGDVMRVYIGDQLIADQFWYGRPFEIDLAPYASALAGEQLMLKAFAWGPDTGVYVDPRVRPEVSEPTLAIHSATLRPIRTRTFQ